MRCSASGKKVFFYRHASSLRIVSQQPQDDRVIAYLDYKKDEWLYYDTGYHWPVMVISAADSASNPA